MTTNTTETFAPSAPYDEAHVIKMLSEDSKYAFVYLSSVLGDGDESEIKLASGRVMTAYNEAGLTAIEIDQKALVLAKALLNERNSELRILTQLFQSIGMKHKSEPLAA